MEDITKFDKESEVLYQNLKSCNSKNEMILLMKRQNLNKISELEIELENDNGRVMNAKASRQKEIESIQQKIAGAEQANLSLECQNKEAEDRLAEQQNIINSLKSQLANAEYSSKRNNNFFNMQ
jgi:hypothetical protein